MVLYCVYSIKPSREEPPLSSGFRNVPLVFPDVDKYHAVRADSTSITAETSIAANPREAGKSVVQILRLISLVAIRLWERA